MKRLIMTGLAALGFAGAQPALADVEAECKSLSIQNDTTGGYLAPPEYVKEIIKGITEMSPVRSLVRVRSTGAKSIMLPKRTGQFAARRVGEQETRTETTGLTWGMIEIVVPEMCALIDISRQNLEDSAFDLEAELRLEADEQFAVKEGAEVVSGTGVKIGSIIAIAAVTVTLGLGLYSLFRGGAYARSHSNRLMRWRVGLQALAVLLLVIGMLWKATAS
mgnify:CR=1 FL=1